MTTAIISECGKYRYRLSRKLSHSERSCLFIMLNPSTADASKDDPTIRRCTNFAKSWDCGELVVVNLFAGRATSPKDMMSMDDPVGSENYKYVTEAADYVQNAMSPDGPIVCAWGTNGVFMDQDDTVIGWLEDIYKLSALKITKDGFPSHPLYLPKDSKLIPYRDRHHQ